MTRKITYTLAAMAAGKQDRLYLGNLDAKRDWGYTKEYVDGMWRMLQQDVPEDYVLATGKMASVRDFLELCLRRCGYTFRREGEGMHEKYIDINTGKPLVEIAQMYYRPAEVDKLCGDPSKAKEKLGWEATTHMEGLADIMLEADYQLFNMKLPTPSLQQSSVHALS